MAPGFPGIPGIPGFPIPGYPCGPGFPLVPGIPWPGKPGGPGGPLGPGSPRGPCSPRKLANGISTGRESGRGRREKGEKEKLIVVILQGSHDDHYLVLTP